MKKSIIFSTFIFVVHITFAQVRTAYFPEGNALQEVELLKNVRKARTVQVKKTMPAFDVQPLMDEDKEMDEMGDRPFQFGKGFDTNFTLKDGIWTDVENGRLWSMQFKSDGAYSINFVFDNFYLSKNAILYVVNANKTMLYGPVTSEQNPKNGYFLTDLIMGDDVTIYLFEPYSEKGKSELTIKRVVHAYKNLFYSEVNFGFGGSLKGCHNDIKCYRDWSNESNAVALVILGDGDKTCSGSLLMNTAHDFKPYFLSAFHCVDIEVPYGGDLSASEVSNAENWMFRFHYKLSSCGGNSPTTRIAYNGATLRAAWDETDFVLLELDHMPHGDSRFSWLGWDRSGNVPSSGTGIHHPAGDVMKISFGSNLYSYNHPITWNYQTTSDVNTHWSIRFDDGGAEGGSSGSPLLDQNRRVVGQLHGGSFTCAPVTKYYGKFDRSWTGGGTHTTRLSNWLDPNNSGDLTIGTPEISAMEIVKYMGVDNCIISNSSNPGDNYYVIQNLGGGTVEVENVYGALIYPMGSNNPQQTVVTPGIFRLEVDPLYNGTDVQIRVRAQEYYGWSVWKNFTFDICQNGYYLSLSPNPSTFGTTISLESPSESARSVATAEAVDVEWELEVYDQNQRLITCKQKLNGKNVTLDTSGWNKGVYIIRATVNEEVIVGKLIIQ